jgi:hypothetical protein
LEGTATAAAVPLEILLPYLAEFCNPKSVFKFLRKDETFQTIEFRYRQITYVSDIAEFQSNIPISINALTRAFNRPWSRVKSALDQQLDLPGYRGKHIALDPDHGQQILEWIRQKAERSTPFPKAEIKDYCISQFQIPNILGWINSFVLRHADDIIQTKSI